MPCTTLLVGKNASYDGSTMTARNEDACAGVFDPKKFVVVLPEDQPRLYKSVLSKVEIPLPDNPVRYTAVPDALPRQGIWGEAGVNAWNVAMTATETITSNTRVLGADPLVDHGIGEEDMLTIVLPYIKSAREGVFRLGSLLEKYGTYEMNGIGFQDVNEIWWLETIGGHHWIAKRVPDDSYVIVPNQQGIDSFDFRDAFGQKKNHLCSEDLISFITDHHLDCTLHPADYDLACDQAFQVRPALGSRDDADHTYNTPRAWAMARYLSPERHRWDGPEADYCPDSDDIPWSLVPDHKITVDDVKYVLSNHFQGTPYDPYGKYGDGSERGHYRPIGINRNNFLSLIQLRPYRPDAIMALQWMAMGSNVFNAFVPFYANITSIPDYFAKTSGEVTTESFYWTNRLIAALADAHFQACSSHIERYQNKVHAKGMEMLNAFDKDYAARNPDRIHDFLNDCNQQFSAMAKKETLDLLDKVLYTSSMGMKNSFARSDA